MVTEPLPPSADPGRLTSALRAAGVLADGQVRNVELVSSRPMILSHIYRLRLTYDSNAVGPASLILKTAHNDNPTLRSVVGRQEIAFYTQVANAMPPGIVPRCFGAEWDAATNAWHLLLEDLTDTHEHPTAWPLPPTQRQSEAILDAWARLHAAWWDDPRLGDTVGTWRDEAAMQETLQSFAETYARFADQMGDRLSPQQRDLYARFIDAAPRLVGRLQSRRDLTIVHGDAHVWNCFLPRDGGDDVRIFDWDSWHIDPATNDLAYMMAMHWYPDLRRQRERSLLDHYHTALVAYGVRDYDRRRLDDDYRWSVLWLIRTPVWQAEYGIPPVIWWNNLGRILLAVDDLGCRDLLD
jgi:thiamine kinase-like enzyme